MVALARHGRALRGVSLDRLYGNDLSSKHEFAPPAKTRGSSIPFHCTRSMVRLGSGGCGGLDVLGLSLVDLCESEYALSTGQSTFVSGYDLRGDVGDGELVFWLENRWLNLGCHPVQS